ncbi:MAG: translation initiation factor IF-2 subunit beta [Nanoarchaeota archaeon]
METYEKLLEEAYKKIKPIEGSKGRFEVPLVESMIEGNKTIIFNFLQIASYLRRKPEHLEKFLDKELAAKSKIEKDRLTLIKKIPSKKIDEKIRYYIEKYVLCRECKKPDTEIIKLDNFFFIHCLACGAKYSISKI